MRWFTCTPIPFGGGPDFFSRDSGLLSRGFQGIGIESRAVMPGERKPEDEPDLIRTDYANLESPEWWKSHNLDGVVLYAWGRPKFRKVAEAIHRAGIFLVLNQDNGGVVSPLNGLGLWLEAQRNESGGGFRFFTKALRGLTLGLAATDPLRAVHLKHGNLIACVSPLATEHCRKLCRIYGGERLAAKVRTIPHPVNPLFFGSAKTKRRTVLIVGRWDAEIQKRPELMMETVALLIGRDHEVNVEIIGRTTPGLEAWHTSLEERNRVKIRGLLPPSKISELMAEAMISYCSSAFESFHIASGEALCSGCSIVAHASSSMTSFPWFCGKNSGSLAATDDAEGHAAALLGELKAWDEGRRSAMEISRYWSGLLHAPEIAKRIVSLAKTCH